MSTLQNLLAGFGTALQPSVLGYCLLGCVVGTIVGMLPGLGPLAAISLLLPATFGLNPTLSLILLAGIYYGAMYGGSTTSILMRIPGESASVVTCIDGYEMAKRGRAGAALCIAAVGSFVAGSLAVVALMLVAPPLADFALRFGPPEMTALLTLSMLALSVMGQGSTLATLATASFGLLIGTVGIDAMTGYARFTLGVPEFSDGLGLIPVAVGLFGLSEIFLTAAGAADVKVPSPALRELVPTRGELRRSLGPIARGSVLGFFIGLLPGAAHVISSFMSYGIERKLSRHPEEFGHGAIEGVAGPESANNAASCGAFVPMLSLGIPSGPVAAVMLAAVMFHGVTPGPTFINEHPDVFWSFVASMYIGNVALLLLNLPLVGLFVNLLRIPYRYLYPVLLAFCFLSVYAVSQSVVDVWVMMAFGAIGFGLRKIHVDPAPIVLGLVLSPMFEMSFRQALAMSGGSYWVFVESPIALVILAFVVVLLGFALAASLRGAASWRARLGLSGEDA
jgi:putative tricarboxylic transport membrane protein